MLCGGNPWILQELYTNRWNSEKVVNNIAQGRGLYSLVHRLSKHRIEALREAINDPDTLIERPRQSSSDEERKEIDVLIDRLTELNMVIELFPNRRYGYIDTPPPEKDLGLGIGRYIAWQTPLHKEAIRKALAEASR